MPHNVWPVAIYFSDFFEIGEDKLAEHGALNVSLINDLPLFVDPFLLFDSEDERYRVLHEHIIAYVKFLRDMAVAGEGNAIQRASWFTFSEVRQNWLGFSKTGNKGSGLGKEFADALQKNLRGGLRDFGDETVSEGSHLEKLCLLGTGVGRDHLSDFTTNLIKKFLLDYTQAFATKHLADRQLREFAVHKVHFDFESRRWRGGRYVLPSIGGDYVILTPREILTKDEAWINRSDMIDRFSDIFPSIGDQELRTQVNDYLQRRLMEDAGKEETRKAVAATIEQFPQVLDYYIRQKEADAPQAHRESKAKVQETERRFIRQVREFVRLHLEGSDFYKPVDSFKAALERVHFLKSVIEDRDGYRIFYVNGKPVKREEDLQLLYRLTWFSSPFSADREVNNGRGPVDYKISKGSTDATLVEFKLASNSKLRQNLKHQVGVYQKANDTASSIKVIMCFNDAEIEKTTKVLREIGLGGPDVVVIDASNENKPSASNVKD